MFKKLFYFMWHRPSTGFEKYAQRFRAADGTYLIPYSEYKALQRRSKAVFIFAVLCLGGAILLISLYFPHSGYIFSKAASNDITLDSDITIDEMTLGGGTADATVLSGSMMESLTYDTGALTVLNPGSVFKIASSDGNVKSIRAGIGQMSKCVQNGTPGASYLSLASESPGTWTITLSTSNNCCEVDNTPDCGSVVIGITGSVCGDGNKEGAEACDDGNLINGDGCSSTCAIETPTVCGNGVKEGAEACDDGNLLNGDGCSSVCTKEITCGNGVINGLEECDDGNLINGDGCSSICVMEIAPVTCMNGRLDSGEQCDDKNLNNQTCLTKGFAGGTLTCSTSCFFNDSACFRCGNGIKEGAEACDDGNLLNGDGCSSVCVVEVAFPTCGNGTLDPGEDCDGTNLNNQTCLTKGFSGGTLSCSANCFFNDSACSICGNNIKEPDEECDDGNLASNDGCSSICKNEASQVVCGNNVKESGEECDGSAPEGYTCDRQCHLVKNPIKPKPPLPPEEKPVERPRICGDGILDVNEECDDGNLVDGDGCSSVCVKELELNGEVGVAGLGKTRDQAICGDTILDEGETCDDGNFINGDGCSANCQKEEAPKLPGLMSFITELPNFFKSSVAPTLQEVARVIEVVREQSEPAIKITTPILIFLAAVNAFSVLPFFGLLPYIFTEPFRYLLYRRRKYGVVYNSLTKQPVDLAIVRLYDAKTNRIVSSQVSDFKGRYSLVVNPGNYYIKIQKNDYAFPTGILREETSDHDYMDLYHGNPFILSQEENVINFNIPLDPDFKVEPDRKIINEYYWRLFKRSFVFVGPIFAVVSLIIAPSVLLGVILVAHILLFSLFRRLAITYRPKSFGRVSDVVTDASLAHAIIRIFDSKYNKLLATQVANSNGKYNFLVGPNVYYLTASKLAYEPYKSEFLDYTEAQEAVIDKDVAMKRLAG